MASYLELPNAEAAVNKILADAGLRAYSSSPKRSPQYPHVVTHRAGGVPAEQHALDAPRIGLDVWGNESSSKTAVWNYAVDAIHALQSAEGSTVELEEVGDGDDPVFVSAVRIEIGPQWLPDPRTSRPRYVATLRVYCRRTVRSG